MVLGDRRSRVLDPALVGTAFLAALLLATGSPGALLGLLAAPLAVGPVTRVRAGLLGRDLVPVLRETGRLQLVFGALLAVGLALG